MPLYMDVHQTMPEGASANDVADAHAKDLEVQEKHGVKMLNYWVDEKERKIFCLADAPDADAMASVHRDAHGLLADEIYEVRQG
jgi:Protein of unknown function (DUF4242)